MKSLKFHKIIFLFGLFWFMYAVKPQGFLHAEYYYIDENGFSRWGHEEESPGEVEPIDDEVMNAFYLEQAKRMEESLENEEDKNDLLSAPGTTGQAEEEAEEIIDDAKKKQEEEEKNQNKKTEENKKKSDEKLKQKDLPVSGDPVKHALGSYEQDETDLICRNLKVIRNYSSQKKVLSSLGYGWTTNLDQRIILGVQAGAMEGMQNLNSYVESLTQAVNMVENEIKQAYGISSLESASASLESRTESALNNIASSDSLYTAICGLENGSRGYPAHDVISSLKSRARSHMNDVIQKYNQISAASSSLEEDLRVLAGYKNILALAVKKLDDYSVLMEKSRARKNKNRLVMFEGMESFEEETGLDTLTVIDENGYPHLLTETEEGSGVWTNARDPLVRECRSTGQGYLVTLHNGIKKEYDANGFLIKESDRNENTISLLRTGEGKITYIKNSFGESYKVGYSGKYITSIINERAAGESLLYSYEENKLAKVTDTDGDTVTMKYDSGGRLTHLYKCDQSFVEFVYGEVTEDGRVLATATKNEEGYEESFYYDTAQNRTIYTDHDGNQTLYIYDENHRTKEEIRPDRSRIINEYDENGNLTVLNENGNKTFYTYDDKGNKIRASYGDGSKEEWFYDDFNMLTMHVARDGLTTRYEMDERGNIISCSMGGRTLYTQGVNEKGLVIWRTVYGQKNVRSIFSYDDFGNLVSESCGGVNKQYFYDERNRVTKITLDGKTVSEYEYRGHDVIQKDYNGLETSCITNGRKDITEIIEKDTVTGQLHKTRIEYDRRHLPLKIFAGDGNSESLISSYLYTPEGKIQTQIMHGKDENWITLYSYENGQIHEVKQYKEGAEEVYLQTYSYSFVQGNKKLLTVTDGLNHQTFFEYDFEGNLVRTEDANGLVRSNIFSAGKLKKEESLYGGWYEYKYDPLTGLIAGAGEEGGEFTQNTYYPDGSLKTSRDLYRRLTYYNYDDRGRLSSLVYDKYMVCYEYDNFDRLTKEITGKSSSQNDAVYYITYEYSEDGRTVTVTRGGKYKTISLLDAFGNVIKETDGKSNTRRYEYNFLNQLVRTYDGYENVTAYEYNALGKISRVILPGGEKSEYHYNYMGLPEKITDECGTVYLAVYDKTGRLIKEKSRGDSEKSYLYDAGGRLTSMLCGGEVIESYEYSADSLTVWVSDGRGEKYTYKYDAFGRLSNEINRNGLSQTYLYDAQGQLENQTGFDGSTTAIIYSSDRSVKTVQYSDGSSNRFVYDAIGNIVEAENAYGKILYRYDQAGLLIYQKDVTTGEELYFEYDAAGNRTRLYSSNRESSYSYGKNNEVKEFFDNKQRLRVQLDYNKNGSEVLRKFGNGTAETTLYDKAGRVTVKAQKSERGEILWAQGYLYGQDGKRTATVDNSGRVTLYEYNKKGQLASVWYPYTQEMINLLKEEALENGLAAEDDPGENRFLPSDIRAGLIPLMNSMQYGLANNLTNLQIFIKETYGYDKNGNRISKTTKYGTIDYSYDKENCLLASGSQGQTYINYTYDRMGNLLTEESALKSTKYAYNAQNRLIYCEVTDKSKKEYARTTYAYDAFGRRIIVQDRGEAALRTMYDGLSFDIIKSSPTFANGMFTDSSENGIRWGKTGKPTGDRYRYISDEEAVENDRYVYLDDGSYKVVNSRYSGERSQVSVNGRLAAQTSNEGTQYFTTDLFGSVSTVSDSSGYQLDSYSYDAFGSLVQGNLSGTRDFGYLGKQQDPTSRLYNYGYRDYKPQSARFTTVDPIRDGTNWFAYVNNDPVNFVDLWGLELTLTVNKDTQIMTVELRVNGIIDKREIRVTTAVVSHDPTKNTDMSRTQDTGNKKTNPTQFPNGTYTITGTKKNPFSNSPNYGSQWITTNATQQLVATDGTIVEDGGYQIHLTNYSNTNGCVGIKNQADMNYLLMCVSMNEAIDPGSSVIIVKGGKSQ